MNQALFDDVVARIVEHAVSILSDEATKMERENDEANWDKHVTDREAVYAHLFESLLPAIRREVKWALRKAKDNSELNTDIGEISVEGMQKIVDANEKLVKELKADEIYGK